MECAVLPIGAILAEVLITFLPCLSFWGEAQTMGCKKRKGLGIGVCLLLPFFLKGSVPLSQGGVAWQLRLAFKEGMGNLAADIHVVAISL